MSAAPTFQTWGDDLTAEDYADLEQRWIIPQLADKNGIRRVTSLIGQQMFNRRRGNLAGRIIPNIAPWAPEHVRDYRLRLDEPPLERRTDGSLREGAKYVQPP